MNESSVVGESVRILLGGGIGAGKSIAGRRFASHGFTVVEADRLGHEVLEPGGAAFDDVATRWPTVLVDGRIERSLLAAIVFSDADLLAELEAITHPHIVSRIGEIGRGLNRLVVEIPVLLDLEGDWTKVYVAAPRSVRRDRAILRGSAPVDVEHRMDRQAAQGAWTAWADEIITNDGTIDDLDRAVDTLWDRLQWDIGGRTSS